MRLRRSDELGSRASAPSSARRSTALIRTTILAAILTGITSSAALGSGASQEASANRGPISTYIFANCPTPSTPFPGSPPPSPAVTETLPPNQSTVPVSFPLASQPDLPEAHHSFGVESCIQFTCATNGTTLFDSGPLPGSPPIVASIMMHPFPLGTTTVTCTAMEVGFQGCLSPSRERTVSQTASCQFNVQVDCPTITLSAPGLVPAVVGTPYPAGIQIMASGGTGPYTFAVTAGALPNGLMLAPDGTISGTPTQEGPFNFTVTATDANGCTGVMAFNIGVECPTITLSPASLPGGMLSTPYPTTTVMASGGTAPYTFTYTGTLPAGMMLASDGTLSGTPTETGSFPITVMATDANGCAGMISYTLVVEGCPTITLSPASLPGGMLSTPYPTTTILASGGTGPYTFTHTGTLPAGMTLASDGTLSGTPTETGSFPITVTATDANGCPGMISYTLVVEGCPTITVGPTSLATGTVGAAYTATTLTASGGMGPYTFVLTGTLPDGMTLAANGTLSGTPKQEGTFNFSVTATDANGCPGTTNYTLVIVCPTITVQGPAMLPTGTLFIPYAPTQFTASGGGGTSPSTGSLRSS